MRKQKVKDGMKEQERSLWKETGGNVDITRYVGNTMPGKYDLISTERNVAGTRVIMEAALILQ